MKKIILFLLLTIILISGCVSREEKIQQALEADEKASYEMACAFTYFEVEDETCYTNEKLNVVIDNMNDRELTEFGFIVEGSKRSLSTTQEQSIPAFETMPVSLDYSVGKNGPPQVIEAWIIFTTESGYKVGCTKASIKKLDIRKCAG